MKVLSTFIIFISLNVYSQDKKSRFPIRLNSFSIAQTQDHYQLDIINMFSDHLILKSEPNKSYEWALNLRLMSFLDFIYRRHTYRIKLKKNDAKYVFDEYQYDFDNYQMGLSAHIGKLALELGVGNRTFHTFLESDTTYYYHETIKSNYKFLKLHYTYPTTLFFDINIFIEQSIIDTEKYENRQQYGEFSLLEGDIKHFGTKIIFGQKYQLALTFSHLYTNVKYSHDFFGLKNEMNNKHFKERIGLELTYNF